MASPSELSLEEIRNYLLENGGTARNHDLVKHFKRFLTDPETRGGLNVRGHERARDTGAASRRVCDVYVSRSSRCKHTGGSLDPRRLRKSSAVQRTFSRYSRGQESVQGVCQHSGHHKERGGRLWAHDSFPPLDRSDLLRGATLPARRTARDRFKISNARPVFQTSFPDPPLRRESSHVNTVS